MARWSGPVVGAAVALLLVGGCSDAAQQEAATAAAGFVAATPADACQRLAPATAEAQQKSGTPCHDALAGFVGRSDPTPTQVEVAGEAAQVRFADQVVFLARFPQGWLVTAAGCVRDDPDPARPYDCEVQP